MVQGRTYKLHKTSDNKNLLDLKDVKIDGFRFAPKYTNE